MSKKVSRVDLSLDDIIKLDRRGQQQDRNRGGNNKPQGNARNMGQGLRGQKTMGVRAQGQSRTGVSPLNRGKTGTTTNISSTKGHQAGVKGQRKNVRGWTGNRVNVRKGELVGSDNGSMAGHSNAGYHDNAPVMLPNRSHQGNQRGTQGNMRWAHQRRNSTADPGNTAKQLGHSHGQGNMRWAHQRRNGTADQSNIGKQLGHSQGQGHSPGQGRGGLKQLLLEQKRQKAIRALQEARKTIAQLDQQTKRQDLYNTRRGIAPQDNQPILNKNKNKGMYASTMSLASTTSRASSASGRQMDGTRIMSFDSRKSPQSLPPQQRWHHKPQVLSRSSSTLTISINNSPPVQDDLSPASSPDIDDLDDLDMETIRALRRQRQRWQERGERLDNLDLSRGASRGFTRQLARLKPTVSRKYVFQKKTFSCAKTPFSLNDRFSAPATDPLMGRAVFM